MKLQYAKYVSLSINVLFDLLNKHTGKHKNLFFPQFLACHYFPAVIILYEGGTATLYSTPPSPPPPACVFINVAPFAFEVVLDRS